jgi:D-3-phosphoglycerate dehydrogenase
MRARARGVWVANSPDYGVGEVATHALAMALSLVRHLPAFDRDVRAGRWHYSSTGSVKRGRNSRSASSASAASARAWRRSRAPCFGAILACDPTSTTPLPGFRARVGSDSSSRIDVVSLHVPLNDETATSSTARTLAS